MHQIAPVRDLALQNFRHLTAKHMTMPHLKPEAAKKSKSRKSEQPKRPIRFLNINCQSVCAKLPLFLATKEAEHPDVIIGSELWLNGNVQTVEIFSSHFQVFRKDHRQEHRKCRGRCFYRCLLIISVAKAEPTLDGD